jgi:fumarylacetoacetase
MMDRTHDPALRSWVPGADSHADFPIQNLPFGIFSRDGAPPRGGVAIGDFVLDLSAALDRGLFSGEAKTAAEAARGPTLNPFLALDKSARMALRLRLSELLAAGNSERPALHPVGDCTLHLPAAIGDYTDFYAGINHALNVGSLLRPDMPLMPNYKYLPVGYHGRASSIAASGTPVRRPLGQHKRGTATSPSFGPSERLDYELELGIWIGQGNPLGQPIPIAEAARHVAGYSLLNDWSARDLQAWEYQPLGPFLAKNFLTTVSPWIVTTEALEPFRRPQAPRPEGDPLPFDYLRDEADQTAGALDIALEIWLTTSSSRAAGLPPMPLSRSNAGHLYWTPAQMVAHHASGGCNLRPGDLFGSGTISGPEPGAVGSLLELTEGGRKPLALPGGEQRRFLEDGDEVILRAACRREGAVAIGFGECRGTIQGAVTPR